MKVHQLKVWPIYFAALERGDKLFDVRRNDREFRIGDQVVLSEWDPFRESYTHKPSLQFHVDYVLRADEFPDALREGYVVLSLRRPA